MYTYIAFFVTGEFICRPEWEKPMNRLINLLSIAAVSSDFHERFPDFGDEAGEDRRYAGYKLVSGGKYQSLQLPRVQVIDSQL